jgi:hypothetical protein
MNCRIKKISADQSERGSVLMETVIALPIFMALIGGIMWSGQLIYEKQKLLVADRYVAWNYGNRFTQNYNDAQSKFFDKSTADSVADTQTKELKKSEWWHEVQGSVEVDPEMPVWTRGWFYGNPANSAEADKMPSSLKLFGRDLSGNKPGGHTVVMQKEKEPKDSRKEEVKPDDALKIKYDSIYSEDWPTK